MSDTHDGDRDVFRPGGTRSHLGLRRLAMKGGASRLGRWLRAIRRGALAGLLDPYRPEKHYLRGKASNHPKARKSAVSGSEDTARN